MLEFVRANPGCHRKSAPQFAPVLVASSPRHVEEYGVRLELLSKPLDLCVWHIAETETPFARTLLLGLHAYLEATPSGETPSGSDAILRNASVQQGCAPTLFEQWAHRFECRGQHMRLYTAHRHKAANTPLYDMERQTYVYTTVFSDERQENAAIHAAAIMPLYVQRHPCRYA